MAAPARDPDQFALGLDAVTAQAATVADLVHGRPLAAEVPAPPSDPILRSTASARRSFVIGRLNRRTRELRLLGERPSPIRGPFTLQAIVRAPGPKLSLV